ncbi:unnamed protein product [Penicillium nalgiovense]|nr:unnamed protein product [Penicillium nalgiovense]
MSPTILIVGAIGNTGQAVVETLPRLLQSSSALSGHRVIGLTRSIKNLVAQKLAELPRLRDHQVTRAFIASYNKPNHFAEESTFHLTALNADVKYVVRISTIAANDALQLLALEDAPVGVIDPYEVRVFTARLLSQEEVSIHNKAKYVLNGPEDITRRQIVDMVEQSQETMREGKCSASTTSKEVLELAAPKVTPAEMLKGLLGE